MPSTIHLRRKIKSVSNTKQITRAMQMVAASKMRRAQEAVLGTRSYALAGQTILRQIQGSVQRGQGLSHPLFNQRPVARIILIVIASDRGLAGGYNANILKKAAQFLSENQDKTVRVVAIGRKAQEGLQRLGVAIEASFLDFPSRPKSGDILPISQLSIKAFLSQEADQVVVIYTRFQSTLAQVAEATQLLPITDFSPANPESEADQSTVPATDWQFEPGLQPVIDSIVPRIVEGQLLQLILEAIASEHSARMIAMKNATDNAGDLIEDLRLTYNGLRQATITREIAEISAGAAS